MWYLRIDGKVHGPLDDKRLAQLEFNGKIPRTAEKAHSPDGPWVPAIVDDGTATAIAKIAEQTTPVDKYSHLYEDEKIVTEKQGNRNTSVIRSINRHSIIYAVLSTLATLGSLGYFFRNASGVGQVLLFVAAIWCGFFSYHISRHLLAGSHYYIQRLEEMGKPKKKQND